VGEREASYRMTERQNTTLCASDLNSPRISSFNIHEWIYDHLRLPENEVTMVQINGPRRHLYQVRRFQSNAERTSDNERASGIETGHRRNIHGADRSGGDGHEAS